jgi:hypothetical protein
MANGLKPNLLGKKPDDFSITDDERRGALIGGLAGIGINALAGANAPQAIASGLKGYTGTIQNIQGIKDKQRGFAADELARQGATAREQRLQEQFAAQQKGTQQRFETTQEFKEKKLASEEKRAADKLAAKDTRPKLTRAKAFSRRSAVEALKLRLQTTGGIDPTLAAIAFKDNPEGLQQLQGGDNTAAFKAMDEEIAFLNTFINPGQQATTTATTEVASPFDQLVKDLATLDEKKAK